MRELIVSFVAMAVLLSACNLAPPDAAPETQPPPARFKEAGPWTVAQPADAIGRGAWWQIMGDPCLDTLEQRIERESPRLAVAVARYDQARALAGRARADLFPQIDFNAGATHERSMSTVTGQHYNYHEAAVGGSVSYELDMWGRVHNLVSAGRAESEASAADVATVKLSLQAELADNYFRLRGLDAQIDLLNQTITAYSAALDLTTKRFTGGAARETDVSRARTQVSSAQSELDQRRADRALLEHAIAALVGEQASSFSITPVQQLTQAPKVPVTAPSLLLQRRPDIAAAERRVAAANARIGAARAAFFPDITLGLSGGFESTAGALLSAGSGVWALGPATALLRVFDGGRRRADLAQAKGEFDEAAANYRHATLDAFREVEDELTLANRLADASEHQGRAVEAAARTNQLADVQYREGAVDYLQVVTAQTAELEARQVKITLDARRLAASVDLVRALGGSWRSDSSSS